MYRDNLPMNRTLNSLPMDVCANVLSLSALVLPLLHLGEEEACQTNPNGRIEERAMTKKK